MIVIDLVLWRQGRPRLSTGRAAIAFCMWDDVVWHDNARSPGSGGASPYLRRGFADGLAFGVTPHRGNQREAGVLLRYGLLRSHLEKQSTDLWRHDTLYFNHRFEHAGLGSGPTGKLGDHLRKGGTMSDPGISVDAAALDEADDSGEVLRARIPTG